MACVGRSVMLSVSEEDEALGKEKVISVITAKGQNALKKGCVGEGGLQLLNMTTYLKSAVWEEL